MVALQSTVQPEEVPENATAFAMPAADAIRYARLLREVAAEEKAASPDLRERFRELARRLEVWALLASGEVEAA